MKRNRRCLAVTTTPELYHLVSITIRVIRTRSSCRDVCEDVTALQRGTLDYMPPEMFGAYDDGEDEGGDGQTRKQPITQAVDVYSFGLVLWQIVTGGHLDKMQGSLRPPR